MLDILVKVEGVGEYRYQTDDNYISCRLTTTTILEHQKQIRALQCCYDSYDKVVVLVVALVGVVMWYVVIIESVK